MALEIVAGLRGHTTGYAVPTFVIDAPSGGGKVPLHPETCVGRDGDDLLLRNYTGKIYRYSDPLPPHRTEIAPFQRLTPNRDSADPALRILGEALLQNDTRNATTSPMVR